MPNPMAKIAEIMAVINSSKNKKGKGKIVPLNLKTWVDKIAAI